MTHPDATPVSSQPGSRRGPVVALDGPASSGKSSVGAAAAAQLGLRFVDTGLLYRALTALALREGVATDDASALVGLVERVQLADDGTGRLTRVLLDGVEATDVAHSDAVDAAVSAVSRVPEVRATLMPRQRSLAADGGIVVAGRDIGTVVLPDADLKLFLDASVEERAARRIAERGLDPAGPEAEIVRDQLRARDTLDRTRSVAPLRPADDALIIRTDGNTLDRTVALVVEAISGAVGGAISGAVAVARPTDGSTAGAEEPASAADGPASSPVPAPPGPAAAASRAASVPVPSAATLVQPGPAGKPARVPREPDPELLRIAMRLDNHKSLLVRTVALVTRLVIGCFANVRVEGLDRIPATGAVILASNHISNADPMVYGAWFTPSLKDRRIHWLGKRELFAWPIFGQIAARGGVHPVERGAADVDAYRLATRILEAGFILSIFPEGTRSPTGAMQEAKDGLATLAMRTGAKVLPIGINNADVVWPKGHKWPIPFPRRTITVRIGEPFDIAELVPAGMERREAKRFATRVIMGRIAELLDPRHRGVYAGDVRPEADRRP